MVVTQDQNNVQSEPLILKVADFHQNISKKIEDLKVTHADYLKIGCNRSINFMRFVEHFYSQYAPPIK